MREMFHNQLRRFRFPGAGFAAYQNDLVGGGVGHSAIGVVNGPVDVWLKVATLIHILIHLVVLKQKDASINVLVLLPLGYTIQYNTIQYENLCCAKIIGKPKFSGASKEQV